MKKSLLLRLVPCALIAIAFACSGHAQQLIFNGDFEAQAAGIAIGSPPDKVDSTTFTGFRFFNITGAIYGTTIGFGAQTIAGASGGTALRLDVNNSKAATAGSYGFDVDNNHPVTTFGSIYQFTFDAAYIGGGTGLSYSIQQYNGANPVGTSLAQTITLPTDTTYHTYTTQFIPDDPGVTSVDILFAPGSGMATANALSLDNIRYGVVPEPGTVALVSIVGLTGVCFGRKRRSAVC